MAPRSQSHQGGTTASACRSTVEWIAWVTARAVPRDARLAGRLAAVVRGVLWASGRRTAASRWRAAGVGEHLRSSYFLDAVGRKVPPLAAALLRIVLDRVDPGGRLLSARDDTPTQRSGPKVPGAGVHHNPTPGPAGAKSLSGPSWVVLNRVVRHTAFGVIGLPPLGPLDVQKDVPMSPATARVAFQTELAIGAAMGRGLKTPLPPPAQRPGLVVDGGYTKRGLLKPALQAGYVLVARLRRDAALYGLPPGIEPGQERPRGRPPVYGKDRRSLVKRAGRARGWQTATLSTLTGAVVTKPVKTSLATWRPAGGAVQGVITKEGDGSRRAVLGTDPEARVETIAQIALERGAIEENFHDVKGVEGIEPVQVRRVWSDVGALDLNPWVPTLIAVWGWGRPARALSDRSARPWDDAPRRPSHADRHKAVQRAMLEADDHRLDVPEPRSQKIRRLLESVVSLVA